MIHEIARLLREEYGIRDLDPDASIRKDLGLSSFDLMNLICLVEEIRSTAGGGALPLYDDRAGTE